MKRNLFGDSSILLTCLMKVLIVVLLFSGCSKKNPVKHTTDVDTPGSVTDIDGNIYRTVKIGNQWWMAENLKVAHYRNGDEIPNVTSNSTWGTLSSGAFGDYDNVQANAAIYGRLYNSYAVSDSRSLAPVGWHVPSKTDWQTLLDYLGGESVAGDKIKETGTAHWKSTNTSTTNESGFSALPGGMRDNADGSYKAMSTNAYFWTSTQVTMNMSWVFTLYYLGSSVSSNDYSMRYGLSVRCVKDPD